MGIYFTNKQLFSIEAFTGSKWDDYMTTKITGIKWKYNGPTTRVEYEFDENHPSGKKKNKNGTCNMEFFPNKIT